MQIDVTVHVSQNYRRVAAELELAARGGLKREMVKAIAKGAKPAQQAVKAAVPEYMPSGYAPLFQRALRLRTSQRGDGVQIVAVAEGKAQKRDIGAREDGSLRHPKWGRRWKPWAEQRIKAHFFTEPIEKRKDDIQRNIVEAIQRVADRIGG